MLNDKQVFNLKREVAMVNQVILINKHELNLTNLDKVLFPATNTSKQITKQALIDYYQAIGPYMLPHLKNRALSLLRFPDGITGKQFFQKNTPDYFPAWIKRVKVGLKTIDKFDLYTICNNLETLVYLANYVCVPHIWLSCYDKLDEPNRLIFDLDPASPKDFEDVRLLALKLHDFLTSLGLKPFALLTGSSGMHVVVPIKRTKNFEQVRLFAKTIAQRLVKQAPDLYTLESKLEKRQDRVFIDILRNSFGATSVAPYAVRDKPGAPVATPITWQAVQASGLSSQKYQITNIFDYLVQTPQPWHDFEKAAVSLTEPIKKLNKLLKN